MLTKEWQAWRNLQVKLYDPRLSALRVCVRTKMVLYKYPSFPFLSFHESGDTASDQTFNPINFKNNSSMTLLGNL